MPFSSPCPRLPGPCVVNEFLCRCVSVVSSGSWAPALGRPVGGGGGRTCYSLGRRGESTALAQLEATPPLCFFPSRELLRPSVAAKRNPRKPQEPRRVRASWRLPHARQSPRKCVRTSGKRTASQVSNHISLRARATGKDPWQFCFYLARWGYDLSLH